MDEMAFDKVIVVVDRPGLGQVNLGKGRLVARDGGLDFQSNKGSLAMRPIRSIKTVGAGVRLEFGEGNEVFTAIASQWGKGGIFGVRSRTRAMGEALRGALQTKELTEAETASRERVEVAEAQAVMKKAKKQMWVWGVVVVAGTIATIASISGASDGGGTYYVFWGAIVFGIFGILEAYFDRYRKYRKVLDRAGAGGGGAASSARGKTTAEPPGEAPDVDRLEKDRDVEGLVAALWRDELDLRVKVMDALARVKDPKAVDLLIAALRDEHWDRRWSAAEALGKLSDPRAVEPLKTVLMDEHALVVAVAETSIKTLEGSSA